MGADIAPRWGSWGCALSEMRAQALDRGSGRTAGAASRETPRSDWFVAGVRETGSSRAEEGPDIGSRGPCSGSGCALVAGRR